MSDEEGLLGVLDAFCAGFATRDPDAVMAVVTLGPELRVVTSEEALLRGDGELRAFLDGYANGPTTYSWEWKRCEARASREVGWVLAEGTETAARENSKERHSYRMTLVCEKRDGRWLVVQAHGSTPLGS